MLVAGYRQCPIDTSTVLFLITKLVYPPNMISVASNGNIKIAKTICIPQLHSLILNNNIDEC